MKVNKNMVSGNTAMLILKLISEKDMYGYEMIDTLSKRSDNVFELKVEHCIRCFTAWYSPDIWKVITRRRTGNSESITGSHLTGRNIWRKWSKNGMLMPMQLRA